jgi:hypothetical protein
VVQSCKRDEFGDDAMVVENCVGELDGLGDSGKRKRKEAAVGSVI